MKLKAITGITLALLTLGMLTPALAINTEPVMFVPLALENKLYLGYVSGDGAPPQN